MSGKQARRAVGAALAISGLCAVIAVTGSATGAVEDEVRRSFSGRAYAEQLIDADGEMAGLATLYGTLSRGIEIHEKGSSGMADPRRPRKFSEEFKRQIVQLYDNGKPVSEIGAEYDLSHSTVHRWIKSIHGSGSTRAADNRTPEQQRILELEKENKQLRMEVDVLKTAALIFARK